MYQEYNRKLILEDGSEYFGYAFGSEESRVCEMVFNTSMAGYQEILSDPSYTCQAVVMTSPLIGNSCRGTFGVSSRRRGQRHRSGRHSGHFPPCVGGGASQRDRNRGCHVRRRADSPPA